MLHGTLLVMSNAKITFLPLLFSDIQLSNRLCDRLITMRVEPKHEHVSLVHITRNQQPAMNMADEQKAALQIENKVWFVRPTRAKPKK